MAEVKKITKSSFKSEWAGPNGIIYYHEIFLEGDDKAWQIGAQTKEPDFLNAGQTLTYEIKDAAKRSLKRVKLLPTMGGNGGGGSKSFERDPLIQELILLQSCTDRAVTFLQYVKEEHRTKENAMNLASYFRDEIIKRAKENVAKSSE